VTSNTDERVSSEGEEEEEEQEEDSSVHSRHADLKACGKGTVQSSEGLMDADEKPKTSCSRGTADVTSHQCDNAGEKPFCCPARETTLGHKSNVKSNRRERVGGDHQTREEKQSTSTATDAEETKRSAPCQRVCKH